MNTSKLKLLIIIWKCSFLLFDYCWLNLEHSVLNFLHWICNKSNPDRTCSADGMEKTDWTHSDIATFSKLHWNIFLRTEVFKFSFVIAKKRVIGDAFNFLLWMNTTINSASASHAMAGEKQNAEKCPCESTHTHKLNSKAAETTLKICTII